MGGGVADIDVGGDAFFRLKKGTQGNLASLPDRLADRLTCQLILRLLRTDSTLAPVPDDGSDATVPAFSPALVLVLLLVLPSPGHGCTT